MARRPLWLGAVGVVVPPFIDLLAGGAPPEVRGWAAAGIVLAALMGFLVPLARAIEAEDRARGMRDDTLTEVADALRPGVERLSAASPSWDGALVDVLAAATRLCGDGRRIRACWYEVRGTGQDRRLVPVRHWGRGARPALVFRAQQARGAELLDRLQDGHHELWPDLDTSRPATWQPSPGNDADGRSLALVPAVDASGLLIGMLMADSPTSGALGPTDVATLRLLAALLVATRTALVP